MMNEDSDSILVDELIRKDERLTIEMFDDAVSDPQEMIRVLLKKPQLYNETEIVLKESRNELTVGFMKMAVENRMMITPIRNDLDRQVEELAKRIEKLEVINVQTTIVKR